MENYTVIVSNPSSIYHVTSSVSETDINVTNAQISTVAILQRLTEIEAELDVLQTVGYDDTEIRSLITTLQNEVNNINQTLISGSLVYVGETPPSNPQVNQLWLDTNI